jgi:lipopolysaccharide heptosyltransferase II
VLALRLSSVGDIVLAEPVVAALRDALPDASIGFVVKEAFRDLVEGHPAIDRVHTLDDSRAGAMRRLASEIGSIGYEAAVDLHRNLRSTRLVRASGAPRVVSYRKRELADAVRVRILRRPFRAPKLLVDRYLDALTPLGVRPQSPRGSGGRPPRPRLYLTSEGRSLAAETLARLGLTERVYAAVAPGAMWPTKRWPSERYAAVIRSLISRLGLRVLLLGSPEEEELCRELTSAVGAGATSLAGETALGEAGGLIARARIFVGNDSGTTHMAMALGVPTVAIFGPTDPGQFDHTGHALIYSDLGCSACSFYGGRRCPKGHWNCMLSLDPGDVFAAAEKLVLRTSERSSRREAEV